MESLTIEQDRVEPKSKLLSRIPAIALAAATGTFLALLILPATSWIVWKQTGMQLRAPSGAESLLRDLGVHGTEVELPTVQDATRSNLAHQHGKYDLPLQLAAALDSNRQRLNNGGKVVEGQPIIVSVSDDIRALKSRGGMANKPSLYANALRYDTQGRVRISRPEDEALAVHSPTPPRSGQTAQTVNVNTRLTGTYVETFLADCATGERLEPDNAYFPMLKAAALTAMGKDDQALTALRRAASLTRWDPHYDDEADGRWRLNVLATGDRGALTRMAMHGAILFPEYAVFRQMARVLVGKSVRAELEGKRDDGLRIRMDIARCGELMRAESPSLIGSMVGIAMMRIASTRPGGVLLTEAEKKDFTPEKSVARFAAYVRANGTERDADWYTRAIAAAAQGQTTAMSGIDNSPASLDAVRSLGLHWLGGIGLLGNALWMAVLGVVGALYIRRWKARKAAGWVREDAFVVAMGLTCIILTTGLLVWSQSQAALGYMQIMSVYGEVSGWASATELLYNPLGARLTVLAALLAIPALLIVGTVIVTAIRRRPFLLDMARSFRAVGLVCAALLVVGYAVVVIRTARHEAQIHSALTQVLQHEGRFMAQSVGGTWPERTR